MMQQWKLPDVGEGIHEAEIVRWLVHEHETVQADQPLVEIQTDKALVEVSSPYAGTIAKLHAVEGEVVKVGTVLVEFSAPDAATGSAAASTAPATTATPEPVAASAAPVSPADPASALAASAAWAAGAAGAPAKPRRRALATPAIRRFAREMSVNIDEVTGTGKDGRVTEEDIRRFMQGKQGAVQPDVQAGGNAAGANVSAPNPASPHRAGAPLPPLSPMPTAAAPGGPLQSEERVALRGLRRAISEHMVRSIYTAPHVTGMDEADATELVAFKRKAAEIAQRKGVKLTYLPFVIKAVVSALKEYPYLNASLDDSAGEIVLKRYYNIGIAVDTPNGLLVPVIANADQKSLLELAADVERLSAKAHDRTLTQAELQGGTFTISNIGSFGGLFATPIINYPEVAILAVGKIAKRPVALEDDSIVVRQMLTLSLTFDHRVIDGGMSGRFTRHVIRYLQNPAEMFLELV